MSIDLTRVEEFALITLNRPDALNALSFSLIADLGRVLDHVAASDARALLVIGAGERAFCAGADIKELTGRSLMEQKRGAELGQATFAKIERLPMPSVAIINGYAFGGGLELALACTLGSQRGTPRWACPRSSWAWFQATAGRRGCRARSAKRAQLEMIMTGRTVDAEEAYRIGLVQRVIEGDALAQGIAYAREFSGYSLPVLALAREAVGRALATPLPRG